jgi:hypothetical protein
LLCAACALLLSQVSRQDLVLCPRLLMLPIKGRLGPRVLYARKRGVKLLAPSLAALVSRSHTPEAQAEWRQHKMVPLDFWLTVSDKRMCDTMGLNADDYARCESTAVVRRGARIRHEQMELSGNSLGEGLVQACSQGFAWLCHDMSAASSHACWLLPVTLLLTAVLVLPPGAVAAGSRQRGPVWMA